MDGPRAVRGLGGWKGFYRFDCAVGRGDVEAVIPMLNEHPEWMEQTGSDGMTALHQAAASGNVELLEVLLAAGAAPAAVERYGRTPLHLAVLNRRADCCGRLLKTGGSGAIDFDGATPLFYARHIVPSYSVALALLAGGADPTDASADVVSGSIEDNRGTPDEALQVVTLLSNWRPVWATRWNVQDHRHQPLAMRRCIIAVVSAYERRRSQGELPSMPPEVWLCIFEVLRGVDWLQDPVPP